MKDGLSLESFALMRHMIISIDPGTKIFISFVKFLEHIPCQSTGRETCKNFPAMEILDISRKFCEVQLKNMHPLDLVCIKNLLSEEAPLKVRDPPF